MVYCRNCGNQVIGEVCQRCGAQVTPMQATQQQTQPIPSKPPSKNLTKFLAVIAVIVVIILILSIVLFAFSGSDEDKFKGVKVEMSDIDEMDLQAQGQLTGNDAENMREYIDDYHGDGDGQVTPDEVKDFEDEMSDREGSDTYEYTINFDEGEYSDYTVSIRGAEGNIDSDYPISVSITATVEWPYLDTFRDFYIIEISTSNLEEKQFSFTAPTGYEINRVDGLVEDITSGGTSVAGTLDEDFDCVYVIIIETGSNPQSKDDEPNNTNDTANSVSDGDEIFGTLDDGTDEDDYYSVYLGTYDTLQVRLYGPDGPNFDLRLYDYDGDQVDYSTGYSSDEYIYYYTYYYEYGTYYIRVQSDQGSGPYIMTVDVN